MWKKSLSYHVYQHWVRKTTFGKALLIPFYVYVFFVGLLFMVFEWVDVKTDKQ